MLEKQVLKRIAKLQKMEFSELKELWLELFEKEAPPFNRAFLEGRLAYRLQEIAFGGLSDEATERLKKLNETSVKVRRAKASTMPINGTILVREFKGVEYRVRVMADGFDFNGIKYKSLTAVALKITGASWNGPEFFGLKLKKVKIA